MQKKSAIQIDVDAVTFAGITALGLLLVVMAMGCIAGFVASL